MKSILYMFSRCRKAIKSTSDLIRHINTCKIPITLLYYQSLNQKLLLEDLSSDNNRKNII